MSRPATSSQPDPISTPAGLSALEKVLLNDYQHDFPLCAEPFRVIAEQCGVTVDDVLATLQSLHDRGLVSRVGPVFAPRRVGASTLAALAVPEESLDEVAALVSSIEEVNHNYRREHAFNLWFVVTAPDAARVQAVLDRIGQDTGLAVLDLPLECSFHIDLGFPLWC